MRKYLTYLLIVLAAVSCSTTRRLGEGEARLAEVSVEILNDDKFKETELLPYAKQRPGTWTPGIYIYNWSSGRGTGLDRMVEKIGQAPVVYDSTLVAPSVSSMLNHLDYIGRYNSTIDTSVVIKNRNVRVSYKVSLGDGYVIDSISYCIPNPRMASIFASDSANYTISKGDILSQEALENESARLESLFRNNGYYGFSQNHFFYYADTTKVQGHCDLVVRMEDFTRNQDTSMARPHRQYTIGKVTIRPRAGFRVKDDFLQSLNLLRTGDMYSEQDVKTTYDRFTGIPVFNTVNVNMREADSTTVDCNISVSPSKLQSVKLNFEASYNSNSFFGIAPSISYSHKNIFGSGETFSLGIKGDFQFKPKNPAKSNEFSINTNLIFPRFIFLPSRIFRKEIPKTEISFAYNYQNRPEYTRNIFTLMYGYSWTANRNLYFQVYPLRANIVRLFNMSEEFEISLIDPYMKNAYSNHFDIGGSASLYYTTDPSTKPEHSYFYIRFQNNYAGNVLSLFNRVMKQNGNGERVIWDVPYSQYVRSELSLVETLRFGEDDQFSLAGRFLVGMGFSYGNSKALPFEQLFYSGGANSLRGWQARSVGPGSAPIDTTFKILSQSGDMKLEANLEFRFPLFWKFEGAAFADAGNVWMMKKKSLDAKVDDRSYFSSDFLKSTALDWGVGLRMDFGLILVRLDLGLKEYDPVTMQWKSPSEWFRSGGYSLHFGIGYPF